MNSPAIWAYGFQHSSFPNQGQMSMRLGVLYLTFPCSLPSTLHRQLGVGHGVGGSAWGPHSVV